ncbi:MAG: hypothetical protein WA004_02455 [Saprospiraceae bacterium]
MKVVSELIEYFKYDLSREDLLYLKEQGFYQGRLDGEILPEDYEYFFGDEHEERGGSDKWDLDWIDDLPYATTTQSLNEGYAQQRSGKGGKKRKERLSFDAFNALLLEKYIPEWEKDLAGMYNCLPGVKGLERVRKALSSPIVWDTQKLHRKLWGLLNKYDAAKSLTDSVLNMAYLDACFQAAHLLPPKQRRRLRNWILGSKPMHEYPNREAFWWIRQLYQLQGMVIRYMERYLREEGWQEHSLHFDMALGGNVRLSACLLLFHFARERQSDPGTYAVHLLANDDQLQQALDAFLIHTGPEGARVLRMLRDAPGKKGSGSSMSPITRLFGKIDLPYWARHMRYNEWYMEGAIVTRETAAPFLIGETSTLPDPEEMKRPERMYWQPSGSTGKLFREIETGLLMLYDKKFSGAAVSGDLWFVGYSDYQIYDLKKLKAQIFKP